MKFGSLERYSIKPITDFLFFWDKSEKIDTVVISTHGLIKKTDKTPQGDLDKAERLRKKYFELKDKKK
jgi:phage-related protein